jgi:hypothetical protein
MKTKSLPQGRIWLDAKTREIQSHYTHPLRDEDSGPSIQRANQQQLQPVSTQ